MPRQLFVTGTQFDIIGFLDVGCCIELASAHLVELRQKLVDP
jgi:hypothetical protein